MVGRKNIIRIKKSSCVYLDCQINLKESNLKERMGETICVKYFIHKANNKSFLKITAIEEAKCNPEHDVFDENVGRKIEEIVRARAEKRRARVEKRRAFKNCINKEIKV